MAVQKIWKDACKNWVNEEGIQHHSEGVGSAPSKDFYILDVSIEELIMQVWRVTNPFKNLSRESVLSKKYRCPYEEFRVQHEFRGSGCLFFL
ncbi:hypothetical protein Btru_076118 [Bulinus truncatus]|nr:hypothetical protein Btru_076118 [Bulinus truncatus]